MRAGVSVVVPFFNEEDGIIDFCEKFDSFARDMNFDTEIIFVNDGSTDSTVQKMKMFSFKNVKSVVLLNFTRNFGSQAAIRAGISKAKYDICTWISVDLQEPMELIPISYEKLQSKNIDIVYIEKEEIDVNPISRFMSKQYNKLMRKYAIKNYPSGGIGALVFDKKVKDYLNEHIEINSAIVLQLLNAGFKNEIVSMKFFAREKGQSKWTLSKKIKIFIDSFVSFSYAPIRLVSSAGILIFFIGLVIAVATVINKLMHPLVNAGYTTIVSVVAMGFGITNISIGIIAEYLWRTFDVSRHQVPFVISEEEKIVETKE